MMHRRRKPEAFPSNLYGPSPTEDLRDDAFQAHYAKETTFEDVVAMSGPLFKTPQRHKRYVPFAVSGWPINPESRTHAGGGHPPVSSWCVLDSADQWREVASFIPRGGKGKPPKVLARALAKQLNQEDAEWRP